LTLKRRIDFQSGTYGYGGIYWQLFLQNTAM
jgi:hypothetical protein